MKINNNHYYLDVAESGLTFEQLVKWLITKGFVFSSYRFTNFQDIKENWSYYTCWKYLNFNTDNDCSRVIHAGQNEPWTGAHVKVTLDELLKLDL